jgi:tRNA-Thr(GGU) m(6)t(6)A37 methyltransferase TsaA
MDEVLAQDAAEPTGWWGGEAGVRPPDPADSTVMSAPRRPAPVPSSRGAHLRPVGVIRSDLKERKNAPRQGSEGAPDAWLEVRRWAASALHGLAVGDEIIVVTWLHRGRRDVFQVHPRSDPNTPLTGVFATRSPDRPNPLGLHPVVIRAIADNRLRIGPIEAIDGTPVVDIKPVLGGQVPAVKRGARSRSGRGGSSSRRRT